jgi:cysteine desulfurase
MRQVYLDYNATTPVASSVFEAMRPFFTDHYGNPSSGHALGRACHEAIDDARGMLATLLGSDADEIVFTGCGTESNNLAILGTFQQSKPGQGHLVVSALEHPAVAKPAEYLRQCGFDVSVVGCNAQGVVSPSDVEAACRPDTSLVSIMHANNEIGVIQPIREISEICRARNIRFHTDAAQSVGKIRTFVDELGVDLLTVAGHKFYGPKGVGALYVRRGIGLNPVLHGADHECGLRPGTENVASIVGLGRAALLAAKGMDEASDRMAALRDRLLALLNSGVNEPVQVMGGQSPRLPNTLSVLFPGVIAARMLSRVPELCASTGSACHSSGQASPILAAIGLSGNDARSVMRLSVGWYTTEDDIDYAASLLLGAWEEEKA